jgi:hypothetical protein
MITRCKSGNRRKTKASCAGTVPPATLAAPSPRLLTRGRAALRLGLRLTTTQSTRGAAPSDRRQARSPPGRHRGRCSARPRTTFKPEKVWSEKSGQRVATAQQRLRKMIATPKGRQQLRQRAGIEHRPRGAAPGSPRSILRHSHQSFRSAPLLRDPKSRDDSSSRSGQGRVTHDFKPFVALGVSRQLVEQMGAEARFRWAARLMSIDFA